MGQQEDPEAEDWQTFDEGTEPRWAGGGQPQHKVDTGGFEEWHQLWAFTLYLDIKERTGQNREPELKSIQFRPSGLL